MAEMSTQPSAAQTCRDRAEAQVVMPYPSTNKTILLVERAEADRPSRELIGGVFQCCSTVTGTKCMRIGVGGRRGPPV